MTSDGQTRKVTVVAHLPEGVRLESGAVLRARVEDASVADRAPDVLAKVAEPVAGRPAEGDVRLEVEVPAGLVDERASYTVFVHLDATGSGEVEVGDALSVQTLPVLTQGAPDEVRVDLRQVG